MRQFHFIALPSRSKAAFVTKTAYCHYPPLQPPNKTFLRIDRIPMTQARRFWFSGSHQAWQVVALNVDGTFVLPVSMLRLVPVGYFRLAWFFRF
jgi:hypothetical protein